MTTTDGAGGPARTADERPWAGDVLDHTRHLMALLDVQGVVLECTASLARLIGTPRAVLAGAPVERGAYWQARPRARRRLREALAAAAAGRAVRYDVELDPEDGVPDGGVDGAGPVPRTLQVELVPVLDGGRVVRIRVDTTDVSSQRAAARAAALAAEAERAERRARHRATALQRVTAALSEAATSEQVAAVMVAESVRWLGAGAARVHLRGGADEPGLVRSAGVAALLAGAGGEPGPVVVPLVSRGRDHGTWTIAWSDGDPGTGGHPGPAQEWTGPDGADLLRTLAAQCVEAVDRARLYEQQREIATVLQRTLLPSVLPAVPGAQVAARYQPGGHGVDVGGDWYDVIPLSAERTGLVIGDVEGHSAEAAAVMGQVRNALRAYAVEGSTPAIVMERLNRLLVRLAITRLVTCCYLEFAHREGTATVVLAGHPPPLVLHPAGHADYVPARSNIVLGVDDTATFDETTVLLDPGACLLLYTDGLVETVSRDLPEGLAALRQWAGGWDPDDDAESLVELLGRRATEGLPVADDVAVLALRYLPVERRPPSRLRAVRRVLPLHPASASAARRFVTDVLQQWGHPHLVHPVTLMTSELVTNSVLHTSGELELGLYLDLDRLRVEVVDRSDRLPALQAPDDDAPGGRGLLIIEALSRSWGVDGRGDGKAVWFEVALGTDPAVP